MKKRLIAGLSILCAVCLMSACQNLPEDPAVKPAVDSGKSRLDGRMIVVDAGHGGFDVGTQGVHSRVAESKVNLAIAKLLEQSLRERGAQVVMTRAGDKAIAGTKDEDMRKRADIIRAVQPDIMISIHQNRYEDASVYGPQVFFLMTGSKAQTLANIVQESLNRELGIRKQRTAKSGEYKILRPGIGPSIIVECGFLSNPKEDRLLQNTDYQKKLVRAIVNGLEDFAQNHFAIPV